MGSEKNAIFCCAHGTSQPCAQNIVRSGFRSGTSGNFGPACYFFPCTAQGRELARNWANSNAGRQKAPLRGPAAVVAAVVSVPVAFVIDLNNRKDRESIFRTSRELSRQFPDNPNLRKSKMCRFLNHVCGEKAKMQKCEYAKAFIVSPFPPLDGSPIFLSGTDACYVLKDCQTGVVICEEGCENV